MLDKVPPTPFQCPNCRAPYKVVRMEAGETSKHREVICFSCGGPLAGREGAFVLKYFLVDKPTRRQDRRA